MRYIIERFAVGHVNNYMYLVTNVTSKEGIIIDPAWDLEKITYSIKNTDTKLRGILLTHSHQDHTNLADTISRSYQCPVYMSKKEIEYYKFRCSNLVPLDDMQVITIAGLKCICILTPGHTAGGMCYKIGDSLFTGDTVFIRSCGFCNCKGSNPDEMYESVNKIKIYAQNGGRIYPGHYFKDDFEYEKDFLKRNLYFHIQNKDLFLKFIEMSGKRNVYLKYEY